MVVAGRNHVPSITYAQVFEQVEVSFFVISLMKLGNLSHTRTSLEKLHDRAFLAV